MHRAEQHLGNQDCEWDEEDISSHSEVTLVRFNSDLMEEDDEQTLQEFLDLHPLEDRKYFVVNRNKGEVIDLRSGAIIHRSHKIDSRRAQPHRASSQRPKVDRTEAHDPSFKVRKTVEQSIESTVRKKNSQRSVDGVENVWEDYWEQSEKIHQKLLMSICQKDYHFLNELFNKKFNPYPINVNFKSFDNWIPIHFAALHGNIVALQTLLGFPELCLNALTNFKWTALHIATKNNKHQAVRLLLKARIECNLQDEDQNSALHLAVELGHKEIVKLIVAEKTVDKELKNNRGLMAKDLCTSEDIMKLFDPQIESKTQRFGFFNALTRNKRYVERILKFEDSSSKSVSALHQSHLSASEPKQLAKKKLSKKDNIIRMYQLLKENNPNQKIGLQNFKFYRKIGEGAFGEVFVVKKDNSERLLALKAIKKQKIIGTNIMRYIQTEKQVLSLIRHPFIVKLNFAFQTDSHLFLAMDYCPGGDLGRFLQIKKKFSEEIVRYYAAEILLALEALHQEKILYRDMKPDNIVLDRDGHVLLTDFGLSKKTRDINALNKSFCGTPAYLPLEIINKKGHNRMADWYEYGIVLYELYTGLPPFFADTKTELYQNVRTGIIRFPRGTPEPFRDLIKRLLSQNPEKRLGFLNDAQGVKEHRWFSGIDWERVYNRELPVPPVQEQVQIGEPIKTKFSEERTNKNLISEWSFIAG